MRILKKLAKRSVDGKPYYKHYITMPVEVMNDLDWKAGTELKWKKSGKKLVLEKE